MRRLKQTDREMQKEKAKRIEMSQYTCQIIPYNFFHKVQPFYFSAITYQGIRGKNNIKNDEEPHFPETRTPLKVTNGRVNCAGVEAV